MRRNLGELVRETAGAFGDDVAFQVRWSFRLERMTYRQVDERARQAAGWLLAKGLAPGDRIVVWSPNMPEYAVLYFGAWLAGVVVVPIDVRTKEDTLDRFVASATPRLAFKSQHLDKVFSPPIEESFDLEDLFDLVHATEPPQSLPDVGPDSLAEIAFTSGTTGEPKGVMLTHGNLLAEIEGMRAAFPLQRKYRALSVLPLSHAFELVIGLLLAYSFGVRVTYVPRTSAVSIARELREQRVTSLIVVPELLRLMLSRIERRVEQGGRQTLWAFAHRMAGPLPYALRRLLFLPVHAELGGHLQFFGCGGARLDVKLAQAWERMGVRIFEGYGLTETSAASTINTWAARRLGTVGKPIPGVEVKIGEEDEILIRSETVTPGYYNQPERTEQAFTDGWFGTDDVGSFDEDGFLRISGRQAFKIVLPDGRNVYPEDVERVLNQHDLVEESCVIGLPQDSGEAVHAVLRTPAPDRADEIVRAANRQLGAHQQIRSRTVWPEAELPRTSALKIDRKQVREVVQQQQAAQEGQPEQRRQRTEPRRAEAGPEGDRLGALIAGVAERPAGEVRDEAALEADLGLDSIGRVELLATVEEELGRLVDESRVTPQTTVRELRELVEKGTETEAVAVPYARWPRSRWARGLRRLLLWAAFRLQDRWMRIEIVHPERMASLPLPSILVFNYQGPYAPLVILRALPARLHARTAMAVDARIWHGRDRWQGLLAALATQAFPIPKGGGAVRPSLEAFGRYLDDGYAVFTSPEGEPEQEGKLLPFQKGTGLIAVEMRVPVVPFKLDGYHRLFPPAPRFPYLPNKRGRVRLIIGEPLSIPKKMRYDEATERVRQAMVETR